MLKHNFKILLRSLWRYKVATLINLFGLSFSFLAILLIVQYVYFENNFDSTWEGGEDVYRVVSHFKRDGEDPYKSAGTVPPVARLIQEVPEVLAAARVHQQEPKENILTYRSPVSNEMRSFEETKVYFSDPTLFEVLKFNWESRRDNEPLNAPWQAVISSRLRSKLFLEEDPIGTSIAIAGDSTIMYEVVGVFEDVTDHSHLQPEVILSLESKVKQHPDWNIENHWYWFSFHTYLKVEEGLDAKDLENKIDELFQNDRASFYKENNAVFHLALQPLKAIHLTSGYEGEFEIGGNQSTNLILMAVAVLILVLACVNYVNISTSQSFRRVKEIGIKKTFGVSKSQLANTFLFETLFLVTCSFVIASLSFPAVLVPFNQVLELSLKPTILLDYWILTYALITILIISLASGAYPAFILSRFGIIQSLNGRYESSLGGVSSRNSILVFQYVIATTLIITTLGIVTFIGAIQNRDLGIDRDQVLVVKTPKERPDNYLSQVNFFKNQVDRIPEILHFDVTTALPGGVESWGRRIQLVAGGADMENSPIIRIVHADEGFEKVYGMSVLAGNSFSSALNAPQYAVLNEEAARLLGVEAEGAVNRRIRFNYDPQTIMERTVIGVVSSYQHHAFRQEKLPIVYILSSSISAPWSEEYFTMKIATADIGNSIDQIEAAFGNTFTTTPFDYFFLDDFFDAQFKKEKQFSILFSLFTAIAIVISVFGTFALLSFFILKKRKEIGIRKVLGASAYQLLVLIFSNYLKKALVASVFAIPLAYFCINSWMQSFSIAFATPIWVFVLPVFGIIFFTILVTTGQVASAVSVNPTETIAEE